MCRRLVSRRMARSHCLLHVANSGMGFAGEAQALSRRWRRNTTLQSWRRCSRHYQSAMCLQVESASDVRIDIFPSRDCKAWLLGRPSCMASPSYCTLMSQQLHTCFFIHDAGWHLVFIDLGHCLYGKKSYGTAEHPCSLLRGGSTRLVGPC